MDETSGNGGIDTEGEAANGNDGAAAGGKYPKAGAVLGVTNPERGESGGGNGASAGFGTSGLENGQ